MELKTKRLLLRPLSSEYLQTTHQYACDPENTAYMLRLPNETMEETAAFLRHVDDEWQKFRPSVYEFAILLEGTHIGAVSVALDETDTCGELGWILNKQYWNRGYATEAAQAVVSFARNTLKLQTLIAQCDACNKASAKVMEKLGMILVNDQGMRTYDKRQETARELTYRMEIQPFD